MTEVNSMKGISKDRGTVFRELCFNGETGWLRNFISVPERGRIFFIQNPGVMV